MFEVGMLVWHYSQRITLDTKPFRVISRRDYVSGCESTYTVRQGNITLSCSESDLVFARLGR